MDSILGIILGFVVTAALILALLPLAHRVGLVDHPGGRKDHSDSTALVGGIAIFGGFIVGMLVADIPLEQWRSFIFAGLLVVVIGLFDDLHEIPASSRFVAQILSLILMIYWGGIALSELGSLLGTGNLVLGVLAVPFTIFCGVGVINAANMLDGLDGLAGGLFLLLFAVLAILAWNAGLIVEAQVLLICCATLLAFLIFNFRFSANGHARTFLGDAGSLFLGLTAAWFIIRFSQAPLEVFRPITGVWLLGLPILDTLTIMTRRVVRGQSPFSPDREHCHHILIAQGFSVRTSVVVMLLLSMVFMLVGLLGEWMAVPEWVMFFGYVLVFCVYYLLMNHTCKTNSRIVADRQQSRA